MHFSTSTTERGIDDISGIREIIPSIPIHNIKIMSAYYFSNSQDREEAIHGFCFEKIFGKTDEEIQQIDMKGPAYIIRMFRNYCIDIKRKQGRDIANYQTKHIDTLEEQLIPAVEGGNIDERIESIIRGYKGVVKGKFNGMYAEIFELMARSYTSKEIAETLNIEENNVNVAKHRIRTSLRCIAASIIL